MVKLSKSPHSYRGQQGEKGRYLSGQMFARVGKGLIGVRSLRGIKWYRFRSIHMPIAVSRMKKADISAGRCPAGSGRVPLESARGGESNSIGPEVSACL